MHDRFFTVFSVPPLLLKVRHEHASFQILKVFIRLELDAEPVFAFLESDAERLGIARLSRFADNLAVEFNTIVPFDTIKLQ